MAETTARSAHSQEANPVGRITIDVKLANNRDVQNAVVGAIPDEQIRRITLAGIVDTGANWMVLPAIVAEQLGLPKVRKVTVRYADRRTVERDMADQLEVEVMGRKGTFQAILEPDRTTALIGAIVLEALDLLVDCTKQRLYPRDPNQMTAEVE